MVNEETRYRLRLGAHLVELRSGETLIGRSDECNLCLDDERVSRVHAKIEIDGDRAVLSDLGSRNGTLLNGRPVRSAVPITDADVIRIGRHDIQVQVQQPTGTETVPARRVTMHGGAPPTHATLDSFDAAAELTAESDLLRKTLQMGRFDEAERLLKARVSRLLSQRRASLPSEAAARVTTDGLLRLAQHSMDSVWLDRLFLLHAQLRWWMELKVEAQAVRLLRAIGKLRGTGLVEYLKFWSSASAELDPGQRKRLLQLRELADHLAPPEPPL